MSTAVTPVNDTNGIISVPARKPDLRDKAIDIKGKQYVQVFHRIIYFNETYPQGSITTELISPPDAETVVIKATVMPTFGRTFTGYSQATWDDGYINKTSALENAETSAVGRALAFMGIGVIDSIASVDEVNKANNRAVSTSGQTPKQELAASVKKTQAASGKNEMKAAKTVAPPQPVTPTTPPIATDADVPSVIGPKPTPDEMKVIKERLNAFELDREALKKFVLKTSERENAGQLTKLQWDEVLAALDKAKAAGSLADLVN